MANGVVNSEQAFPLDKSFSEAAKQPPPRLNGTHNNEPPSYSGSGLGDTPRSPSRTHKRVSSKPSNSRLNGSVKKERDMDNGSVQEKYRAANGDVELTSIKPADEYEEELRIDQLERNKRRAELVSGRRAGAGWARSRYSIPDNSPLYYC
jgi:2-acylglycerol O-acyltransferase 2